MRELTKILKTNSAVCGAVGSLFVHQLSVIFLDMLNLYTTYRRASGRPLLLCFCLVIQRTHARVCGCGLWPCSEQIRQAVQLQGAYATRMSHIRSMRGVKKEILRLLSVFIEKSGEPEASPQYVAQQIVPPVLEPILTDYQV
jgi:exportin-1